MMPVTKLDQLPIEVLLVIIQKLNIKDVYNLILTCKSLKNLILNDNGIWRSISQYHKFLIIQEHRRSKEPYQSWYDRCRISHNWCKARFKNKNVIYHHRNYMPWLKYHESEALLLSVGSDLQCYPIDKQGYPDGRHVQWKLSMPKLRRNDKRSDDISRFVLKENLLVCGNRNGSVAVYKVDNINSYPEQIQYIDDCFQDGVKEVSAVEIVNNRNNAYLVTGSTHSNIVLFWNWDMDNDCADLSRGADDAGISFAMELTEQSAKCLAFNKMGDKLAIGPDCNSKPVLVDINRVEFVIKSEETAGSDHCIVQDIQWHDENTLCYVTHSGWLQMMDIRTQQVVYFMKDPFNAAFYCVKTDGENAIIAGTSLHARCVLFDARQHRHKQIYFTQDKSKTTPVYSLDFDSNKLITAGAQGVAVLDFNVPTSTPSKDYSYCLAPHLT